MNMMKNIRDGNEAKIVDMNHQKSHWGSKFEVVIND